MSGQRRSRKGSPLSNSPNATSCATPWSSGSLPLMKRNAAARDLAASRKKNERATPISEGIAIIEFTKRDIVRHPLVQRIIAAYEAQRGRARSRREQEEE